MPEACQDFPIIHRLGLVEYQPTIASMKAYNEQRKADSEDQIWLLEHPPVFTQGLSCESRPRTNPANIPVVKTDRGGQITYHGPGQAIAYLMIDLKRSGQGIRHLVHEIEQAIIEILAGFGVDGARRQGAPGVYVNNSKIAALGLRVRKGCTYHGLSLNVDMDLEPFSWIDPCGYEGLTVTNLREFVPDVELAAVFEQLAKRLPELVRQKSYLK